MHLKLFETQDEWIISQNPEPHFLALAKSLDVDIEAFERAFRSNETKAKIKTSQEFPIGMGIAGVPLFYLNGESVGSPRSPEEFARMISYKQGPPQETVEGRRYYLLKPDSRPPPTSGRVPSGTRTDPFVVEGIITQVFDDANPPAVILAHGEVANFMVGMKMLAPVADASLLDGVWAGMEVVVWFEELGQNEYQIFRIAPK